jgi:O-6-methylguanine DNA methyltransferase
MSIRRVDDVYAAAYRTVWGDGWVYVRDGRLVGVELPGEGQIDRASGAPAGAGAAGGAAGGAAEPTAADSDALSFWARQLEAYFAGKRTTWTAAEVPLGDMRLGVFERAVYETLLGVPAGETVSYGELAEMAGYPRAARAVGNAMAENPIPIVVPCHRVIRSDGTMGKYGNDPTWKERLLLHEGWSATAREGS